MHLNRTHLGLAGLVVAVALTAAACTSDEPAGRDPLDRIAAATVATREAGTARMQQTIVMTFPEQTASEGSVQVDAEGLLDIRGRRGRLSITTEGTGMAGADALGGDAEMILDGRAMYMKSAFYQQLAPNHEPWLRVSFEELGLRGASQLGQQDPLAFVESLQGVGDEVEELGEEEVRGEPTTHLSASIDVDRLVEELPDDARAGVLASFEQLGIETMPIEVWIDADDRIRRMTSEAELTGAGVEGGTMELALELYDFGVAFDLRVPPDDQVADFSEVFGG